jgi:hypothetical protein
MSHVTRTQVASSVLVAQSPLESSHLHLRFLLRLDQTHGMLRQSWPSWQPKEQQLNPLKQLAQKH